MAVGRAACVDRGIHGAHHDLPAGVLAASVWPDHQEPARACRHRAARGPRQGRRLMDYLTVKWLHILSSTILFGAGVGSALHLVLAALGRKVDDIAATTRHVVVQD